MFRIIVGHSYDPDSESAIQEVIESCQQDLAGLSPCAGILLAAPDYEYQVLLETIDQVFPDLELIGGTTSGELSSVEGFQQDSLVLALFCTDTVEIRAGIGQDAGGAPQAAAQQAVQQATETLTQPLKLCLTLPDGLTCNGTSVVSALMDEFEGPIPIVGGSTGEDFTQQMTYQFFKTQVLTNSLPILVFSGNIKFSIGVKSGCGTLGSKGIVTKVDKNIVYEIDDQPARSFYDNYFGDLTISMSDSSLAVYEVGEDDSYVRFLQEDSKAEISFLKFTGDIPVGSTVQIMESSRSDLLGGARDSLAEALANYPGDQPGALFCFSCAGRHSVLGKEVNQEYDVMTSLLNADIPIAGFYTYGEIAPLKRSGKSHFHNFTMVSLLFGTE